MMNNYVEIIFTLILGIVTTGFVLGLFLESRHEEDVTQDDFSSDITNEDKKAS